ncbi:ATP-binding protein [Stenotrophomonas sp.]|uniref:sensor histidine kinase n=1 Tax=Stenotrophomonas sp. TaxID=69392 RepID=UPI0028A7265A|nr:ATP-binding protein [Stenotrophomonas sp.]
MSTTASTARTGPRPATAPQPLGRRTETMLRGLLCLVGLFHLLMAGWTALRMGVGLDPMVPVIATLHALLCGLCLWEQRAGRSLRAAAVFVCGQLLLLTAAYVYWGLAAQLRLQLVLLMPVMLVSAVLGRRPLAGVAAWISLLIVMGAWVDASSVMFHPDRLLAAVNDLAVCVFGTLLAAWLLHHSVTGLRESLQVARDHGRDLARKRDQLQLEMQEKERSRGQLVHAMKMENVGRLASGIAHDFNHLLALIQSYIAKARRSQGSELQAALQGGDSAVRRATAVSRRLLDFSRLEDSRPCLLDVATVVSDMAPMLQQVFHPGVRCEVDSGQVQCLIHFDPAQLESILISLAVNANQAMPEGGHFSLTVTQPSRVDEVVLRASDSGHGMSEEVRARCLEPFFTTKPMGQGTGLGLAVTASLVQAAGGHIDVESARGRGTQVCIRLPTRPRAAAQG